MRTDTDELFNTIIKYNVFCSRFANNEHKSYICFMKRQSGMRPQDIVVLLKIVSFKGGPWQYRDLAASLFMPLSEVSNAIQRNEIAGLMSGKRNVHRQSLLEFLIYGLHYVFPQVPGTVVTGVPTAHAHPFYAQKFSSELPFVWPYEDGPVRGLAIEPLYAQVPRAVLTDSDLYLALASIDIIRVGRTRERKVAIDQLQFLLA